MKRRLTFCGVLSLALSLFCGTALAADAQVTPTDPNAVQVEKVEKGEDAAFKVTKTSGAQEGQLYLIMIQEGDDAGAKPKPTKDNLYYLNVEAATGASLTLEAYPKDLAQDSSYIVYLSDYSAGSDGAAKGVAVISTKASTTPGSDNPGGDTEDILYGDVNGDEAVNVKDRIALTRHLARWTGYAESDLANFPAADVNADGEVNVKDRIALTRYLAHWAGYETLPYKS